MKNPFILATTIALSSFTFQASSFAAKPPNILFIIADDASMNTFGAYGGKMIKTPAFDRLAEGGAIFRNAYNCTPKCAPARACLVAGNPEYDAVKKELRTRMEKQLTDQRDPRTLGNGDIFDAYPYDGKQFDYKTGKPATNKK